MKFHNVVQVRRLLAAAMCLSLLAACQPNHVTQNSSAAVRQPFATTQGTILLPAAHVPRIEQAVRFLAAPQQEGRGVDTAGIGRAAEYIAAEFAAAGLVPPPGQQDFFQPLVITTLAGLDSATTLSSGSTIYKAGEQYMPLNLSAQKAFEGPLVFVGYGITNTKSGYDDYQGIDVRGKVALCLRYEPHDAKGRSAFSKEGWSSHAEFSSKARNASQRGAVALLVVNGPDRPGADTLMPMQMFHTGGSAPLPVVHVKRTLAEQWLKQGGAPDLKTLQTSINARTAPASVQLKDVLVRGNVAIRHKDNQARNVVGLLPGRGLAADEYVVVGAHYDHLGYGGWASRAPATQAVHPGADDNASGTAAVIEAAHVLAGTGGMRRSILFVCFTGEELGLIGSKHFVNHSPVPLSKIVAMVNLDMVGRLRKDTLFVGGAGTSTPLSGILDRAAAGSALTLKSAWKSGFAPSDNTSFLLKKIPALFFFTGLHEDYHRPSDTADLINYGGMGRIVDLVARLTAGIAVEPRLDFIAPMAPPATTRRGDDGGGGNGASLGIIPDYGGDANISGVLIQGTMPGTPAAKAGLVEGDIIVQLGEARLTGLQDLSDVLANSSAGQQMRLIYLRGGKTMSVDVVLAARARRE